MQNMNLSMTPYTQAGNFVCSQYDVGRQCQIQLVDENGAYTIPSGATVTVMATKPSGLGFSVDCTWSGSTVTFTTTNTMTNEFGRFPAELRITSGSTLLGTTNFWFKVERSPHPDEVIDGDVIIQENLVARVTTLEEKMTSVESDITDLKADIGDLEELETEDKSSLVNAINEARGTGGGAGVPSNVRQAMLTLFESAAYAETGLTDELAIVESWAEAITEITLNNSTISISGASTSQLVATTVPSGGTVTWSSSDISVATVSSTGLVTGVENGTATITASCGGLSARCTATVSGFTTLVSISAVYTQSGTVYPTTAIDDLKTDLVVTGTYDDSSTKTLTEYTLSGTLAEGTSTITVAYGGKIDTFDVIVRVIPDGYTKYDYLHSNATSKETSGGGSYIDTGITFANTNRVRILVDCERDNITWQGCVASIKANGAGIDDKNGLQLGFTSDNQIFAWGETTARVFYTPSDINARHQLVCERTSSSVSLSVDNELIDTVSGTMRTIGNHPLSFFAGKYPADTGEGGVPYFFKGKIYYAEVEVDDVVVGKFYPCVRDSDEQVGMYNTINDTFIYPTAYTPSAITAGND